MKTGGEDTPATDPAPADVTLLLRAWRAGDARAGERLMEVLYRQLREMARRRVARERAGSTLQTTALVHETYLRLVDQRRVEWRDRGHFLALAATTMRRVLVDRARARSAGKRGAGVTAEALTDVRAAGIDPAVEVLDVDRTLGRMAAAHPPQGRGVGPALFGG